MDDNDSAIQKEDEGHRVRSVPCPNCRGNSVYAKTNPYRPFCSERCKGMDFGSWADEAFRMAAHDNPDGLGAPGELLQ